MLTQIIIIASICFFIYICYKEEMIFGFMNKWYKKHLPEKLWKPVFNCPYCLTPHYGSIIYWIFFHVSIAEWILVVLTAGGLQVFYIAAYSIYIDVEDFVKEYKERNRGKILKVNLKELNS